MGQSYPIADVALGVGLVAAAAALVVDLTRPHSSPAPGAAGAVRF